MDDLPSAPPSRPTTLISTFPAEIVCKIFELGVPPPLQREDYAPAASVHNRFLERYSFLKCVSLVCRNWKAPACALIWDVVYLSNQQAEWRCRDSPAFGEYVTRKLVIFGQGAVDGITGIEGASAKLLLEHFNGLDHLTLRGFHKADGLTFRTLCSDNLHTLTSLTLNTVYLRTPRQHSHPLRTPFPLRAPFTLRSLRLYGYKSPSEELFSFFGNSKLTLFHIVPLHHPLRAEKIHSLVTFLKTHSGQLRVLEINSPYLDIVPSL